ncbi:MAG: sulfatase-like hydrolase/transferase, partial [Gammaproteobacteria bacterium]|nr:sulfatase-like hydrolase/transferase [Gammaproteobacteria bacterium]
MMKPEARARRAEPSHFALWASAMLPAVGLCVFAPLGILQTNAGEFDSTPPALVPVLLLTGFGLGAVLALVGHALPRAWRLRWTSLLFVGGLLFWLQGAFLMHDYGVLDGRGMRFEGFGVLVSADLLLWLAALASALVFAPRLAPIAGFGATVFIVLQALPLAAFLLSFEGEPKADGPLIPPNVLEYSSTRNIVHVVFDNFQTDVFEQIVDEQGWRERFDGFTLFGNNLAVAPHTSLAVPAIFSGRPFDGRLPADEYYQQAIADGFHTRLLNHGMAVNLLPLMSMREGGFTHYFEPPRMYGVTERQRLLQEAVKLIDVALFRQLPHMVRPWVYNDNRWRLSRLLPFTRGGKGYQHRRFLADYIAGIRISGEGPAYHYVHIWSPHPPFTTLADGRPARAALANTRENYLNEAGPTVALMIDWIERLKMLGIYDDSLVIFQSDHGGGYEPDFMPTRSLALLAVKPPGQSGPMRVSDSPSTVADVAATVLDEAGIDDPAFSGPSLFSLSEADRVRRFVFRHEGDFHITEVRGHVADPASYAPPRPLDTVQG